MIGQLATSKAGHDRGELYVIVGREGDFVYLSDGRLKAPDKPKKKRLKHIQPVHASVDEALSEKLQNGEKVYPEEIKSAIKKYLSGEYGGTDRNMEEMYVKKRCD